MDCTLGSHLQSSLAKPVACILRKPKPIAASTTASRALKQIQAHNPGFNSQGGPMGSRTRKGPAGTEVACPSRQQQQQQQQRQAHQQLEQPTVTPVLKAKDESAAVRALKKLQSDRGYVIQEALPRSRRLLKLEVGSS